MVARSLLTFAQVAAFALVSSSAIAEGYFRLGEDWLKLDLSASLTSKEPDQALRFGSFSLGDLLSIEHALGFDPNSKGLQISGYWQPSERHSLRLSYFQVDKNAGNLAETGPRWEQTIDSVGSSINSSLELRAIDAQYGYSFLQTDSLKASALLGVYSVFADGPSAANNQFDNTTSSLPETYAASAARHLPLVGIEADYYITPNWVVHGVAQAGVRKRWDSDGPSWRAGFDVSYMLNENFGIGAGYQYFDLNLSSQNQDAPAGLSYRYQGLSGSIIGRF